MQPNQHPQNIQEELPSGPFVSMDDFLELPDLDSLNDLDYCEELIQRCEKSVLYGLDAKNTQAILESRNKIHNFSESAILQMLLSDSLSSKLTEPAGAVIGKRDSLASLSTNPERPLPESRNEPILKLSKISVKRLKET